ncbi:uncharacterized protein K444DRAFT_667186 [Hyaloscypha bicolor E]|uniref:Uncharacterized protein n=1 Tax=Hyaloscypha bicolor E TaxID=1095630 RepID=A0A2J6SUN7_9HELO|nr:uncharacterized protein K444DRAFT_667186 [Hyaloscypha bicolor E]PMD54480.1 hypothetical protein K444DRAFT_667186 [Hyaloscypha bicolor E]
MSRAIPAQDTISPRAIDVVTADFSELELSDPRFRFFSDAIKATSDPGDSLSEEEKAALSATKLKLKHDASLLALDFLEKAGAADLLQGFGRLAASFGELDLQKQVSFLKAMDKDFRQRFEDTRKKIDNMELVPDPMTDLLLYMVNAMKVFQTCTRVFEGMTTTLYEFRVERVKLFREWQNRLLLPCGSSSRAPSMSDYDFTLRKYVLMQKTWSKLQKFKMELDPSEGMRLLGLANE